SKLIFTLYSPGQAQATTTIKFPWIGSRVFCSGKRTAWTPIYAANSNTSLYGQRAGPDFMKILYRSPNKRLPASKKKTNGMQNSDAFITGGSWPTIVSMTPKKTAWSPQIANHF